MALTGTLANPADRPTHPERPPGAGGPLHAPG